MKKKEKPKVEEFEILATVSVDKWGKTPIPEGATHVELEVDYSGCYYEGDTPSYNLVVYKKKS